MRQPGDGRLDARPRRVPRRAAGAGAAGRDPARRARGRAVAAAIALRPMVDDAIKEITLPLRHEDIIRQQARDKNLDPALIAAVIYRESKFRDADLGGRRQGPDADPAEHRRTSSRAQSGGTEFEQGDLANPQINISYGSWYLRYLLDRYDGNAVAAVAAYNAGHARVDRWGGSGLAVEDIRFAETEEYTRDVLDKRGEYADSTAPSSGSSRARGRLTLSEMPPSSSILPIRRSPTSRRRSPSSPRASTPGSTFQTLLGVTGSGKTATMGFVIEKVQKPTLVLAHNKTLAAQLCSEFREFFPDNAVEYFVSYYDYYQPEAYVPHQDLYIEKDSSINDEIDRLRHAATAVAVRARGRDHRRLGLVHLRDRLAGPLQGEDAAAQAGRVDRPRRDAAPARLDAVRRNDANLARGNFRVRGEVLEVHPVLRRERLPDPAVRRRDRADPALRPAHRRDPPRARPRLGLAGDPLRDLRRHHRALAVGDARTS